MKLIHRKILEESIDFPIAEGAVLRFHTGIRRGLDNVWRREGDGGEVEFSSDNWLDPYPVVGHKLEHLYWWYHTPESEPIISIQNQIDVLAFIICEY